MPIATASTEAPTGHFDRSDISVICPNLGLVAARIEEGAVGVLERRVGGDGREVQFGARVRGLGKPREPAWCNSALRPHLVLYFPRKQTYSWRVTRLSFAASYYYFLGSIRGGRVARS